MVARSGGFLTSSSSSWEDEEKEEQERLLGNRCLGSLAADWSVTQADTRHKTGMDWRTKRDT